MNWKTLAGYSSVIVTLLSGIGFTGKAVYSNIKENAELKAEVKYRDKYEVVITDNIRYRLTCDSTK